MGRTQRSATQYSWTLRSPEARQAVTNDIRILRERRELSQGQLAEALRVSRQTINAIETGRYLPSLPLAFVIARYFGRPIEELFHDGNHD